MLVNRKPITWVNIYISARRNGIINNVNSIQSCDNSAGGSSINAAGVEDHQYWYIYVKTKVTDSGRE